MTWVQVSPTQYAPEQEAFDFIRAELEGHAVPYEAWANFRFMRRRTPADATIYEVDLLLLTLSGCFLIEVKSWVGTLSGNAHNWTHNGKAESNPVPLADTKAQLIGTKAHEHRRGRRRPRVMPVVFFSNPSLRVDLNVAASAGLYGRPGHAGLAELTTLITATPPARSLFDEHAAVLAETMEEIALARLQTSQLPPDPVGGFVDRENDLGALAAMTGRGSPIIIRGRPRWGRRPWPSASRRRARGDTGCGLRSGPTRRRGPWCICSAGPTTSNAPRRNGTHRTPRRGSPPSTAPCPGSGCSSSSTTSGKRPSARPGICSAWGHWAGGPILSATWS